MSHSCKLKLGPLAAEAFRLYAANWLPLLVLASANAVLFIPWALLTGWGTQWLAAVVGGLLSIWSGLSMVGVALQQRGGATLLGALSIPSGRYLRCLTGTAVFLLTMLLLDVVRLVVLFALGATGLVTGAIGNALLFVIVYGTGVGVGLCAAICLSLVNVLLVAEPGAGWLPVKRSWELMKQHAWPAVAIFAMVGSCSAPAIGLSWASYDFQAQSMRIARWPWYWCSVVVGAISAPLVATAPVALYQAIRMEASE